MLAYMLRCLAYMFPALVGKQCFIVFPQGTTIYSFHSEQAIQLQLFLKTDEKKKKKIKSMLDLLVQWLPRVSFSAFSRMQGMHDWNDVLK